MSGRLVARYYDPRFGRFLQQDPLPDVVEQARVRAVAAFSYEALAAAPAGWTSPEFEAREKKLAAITESGWIGNKLRAFEWLREEVNPREATGSTFANNAGGAARKESVKRAPSVPTGTPRDTSAHLADPGAEARPSAIVPSAGIAPWDPDVWNLYAYCSDNPLVNTDPDGKIVREQWKQKSVELLQTGKTWDWVKAAGIHVGLATLEVFSLGTFSKNDELSDRYLAGEINESQYKSGMAINGGVALGSLAVGGGTGALASRAVAGVGSKLVQGALIGGAAGFGASTTEVMGTRAGYGVAGIEYRGSIKDDVKKIAIATGAGAATGTLVAAAIKGQEAIAAWRAAKTPSWTSTPGQVGEFSRTSTPWGRTVWRRSDIGWQFKRPDRMTNLQAARAGYAPMREAGGTIEKVQMHHLNQSPSGSLAEVWEPTHYSMPHGLASPPSWRVAYPAAAAAFRREVPAYWRWRASQLGE